MAITTIDCVDCGASVPYGRLSCPACGALLASVAGAYRAPFRMVKAEPAPPEVEEAVTEVPVAEAEPGPAQVADAERVAVLAPVAVQAHVRARPRISPRRPRVVEPAVALVVELPIEPEAERSVDLTAAPAMLEAATEPAVEPTVERAFLEPAIKIAAEPDVARLGARPVSESPVPTPWAPLDQPAPILTARPYQRHISYETGTALDPTPSPGAYRPPAQVLAAAALRADIASTGPRWPSATAAAALSATKTARAAPDTIISTKRVIDAAAFVEIAGWFVIVGATMSVLGFLLPWSASVIGAHGVGGYFNGWGLASPTHVFVFLGLLAVLALGVVRTRVPAWLGSGVLGLALGGLLIGLIWPYLVGPLGADVGVTVTALGGLALVIGGAVASWATRHAASDPLV